MTDLLINPPLDDVRPAIVSSLNRCFPHWGGDREFWWHFVRTVGDRKADVMLVRDGDRFVAGSAVVYRPVRFPGGQRADVGIMASSWTLPEARGQGHFSRIIEASVELARDQGAAQLVAYVTSVNASARRLLASGATGYPTHYLIGDGSLPAGAAPPANVVEMPDASIDDVMNAASTQMSAAHFVYTRDEWRGQFLTRPDVTRILRIGTIGTAVVETKNEFDRLLAFSNTTDAGPNCLASLIAWSHSRGQKFFFFTTSDAWRDEASQLGMRCLPGYLTSRVAAAREHFLGPWWIQTGDRM